MKRARTATAMKSPATLFEANGNAAALPPASMLACCTRVMAVPVWDPTVKPTPLLAWLPTVTTTLPVVAPLGTGTTILVADQLVGVAVVPLNVTVLVPLLEPKFVPPIGTEVPTDPLAGVRLVRVGAAVTEYVSPLLAALPTVTTTAPLVAPVG